MKTLNTNIPGYNPLVSKLTIISDRNKNNIDGGIAIWVDDQLEFEVLTDLSFFEEHFFESWFIKIHVEKNKFKIICNIYRPPGSDLPKFKDKFIRILEIIERDKVLNKSSKVLGDFNVNLLNHSSHSGTSIFLNNLLSKGLLPLVTFPIRISQNSSTLKANIFIK